MYENAQAAYAQQENQKTSQWNSIPGQLSPNGLYDVVTTRFPQTSQLQAQPSLILTLQETEKLAFSLEDRLNSLRLSLFGPELNGALGGSAKDPSIPSAKETAESVARILNRMTNTVAILEQQIGGR